MTNHDLDSRNVAFGDRASMAEIDLKHLTTVGLNFLSRLRSYLWLLVCLFVVLLFVQLSSNAMDTPQYTAVATIGPPNPSPAASMLSSMSMTVGGGGLRSLIGRASGGGGSNDPFQEYRQLLISPLMFTELAQTKGFLPSVFPNQWDQQKNKWKDPGFVQVAAGKVKQFLNRPVSYNPDAVTLSNYLKKNLDIEQAENVAVANAASAVMGNAGGYLTLSLTAKNPQTAERILSAILDKADAIIRQRQLRDVEARIGFIGNALRHVTQSEQKDALIQVLNSQQQLEVMMVADKRFAYVMISPPYASPIPTRPGSPSRTITMSFVLSIALWFVLVAVEPRAPRLRRWLSLFRRPRASATEFAR